MEHIKKITEDLWRIVSPFLLRLFISLVLLSFLDSKIIQTHLLDWMCKFRNIVFSISDTLSLSTYYPLIVLVVIFLTTIIFGKALSVLHLLIFVGPDKCRWDEAQPEVFDYLRRFYPPGSPVEDIETSIQHLFISSLASNKYGMKDVHERFETDFLRYRKYSEIILFEMLLAISLLPFAPLNLKWAMTFLVLLTIFTYLIFRQFRSYQLFVEDAIKRLEFVVEEQRQQGVVPINLHFRAKSHIKPIVKIVFSPLLNFIVIRRTSKPDIKLGRFNFPFYQKGSEWHYSILNFIWWMLRILMILAIFLSWSCLVLFIGHIVLVNINL